MNSQIRDSRRPHDASVVMILSALFAYIALLAGSAVASDPPNIILILADDMALGDFASANGGMSTTPNLDRLASQSVRFDQAYSASCVCAPARAALLTGRYPHRTGVVTLNMNRYPALTRLRHDESTIAEVLGDHGYATGLIGKWHCGSGEENSPLRHGFDEFEGFSGSQNLSYFKYTLQLNDQSRDVDDQYLTEDLSQRAIQFVQRHRDEPFLLHLAHYAPHRPLEAPAELVRSYRDKGLNESTATIYAMIEVMDRGIGELLSELQRLKLDDRTVVIFASDNGPDPVTGPRFNQDLKGMKYEVYEGGIRVPLMIRWPGTLRPARVSQLVHFVDLFPTILDLCGIAIDSSQRIDGVTIRPLLSGQSGQPATRFWQWNRGRPNYTHNATMRDGPWKLVRPYVTREANPEDSNEPPTLFNLADDPTESHDLSEDEVDRTARMNEALEEWCRTVERDRVRKATTLMDPLP